MYHGANLKKARTDFGLSLRKLSAESGVHAKTLARLEKGEGNPKINTLAAIARYFDMTIDELFIKNNLN